MKLKSVLERGSTFTCDLSYIASILMGSLNRFYARNNVKITQQWKSTLTKEKKRRKRKSEEAERRRRENKAMTAMSIFIMAKLTEKVYWAVTFSKMRLDIHCK